MTNVIFLVFRTFFITIMTVGMMASMTEFRFQRRKLLWIIAVYSIWVLGSSLALLWFGGELLLLRLFFLTILFRLRVSHTGRPTTPPHRRFSTT